MNSYAKHIYLIAAHPVNVTLRQVLMCHLIIKPANFTLSEFISEEESMKNPGTRETGLPLPCRKSHPGVTSASRAACGGYRKPRPE